MTKRDKSAREPVTHDWPIELTFQLFAAEPDTQRSPLACSITPPSTRAPRREPEE
jgi:hypothetical protein